MEGLLWIDFREEMGLRVRVFSLAFMLVPYSLRAQDPKP